MKNRKSEMKKNQTKHTKEKDKQKHFVSTVAGNVPNSTQNETQSGVER